ncbi:hypothetical protein M407DRAFT_23697 [Tulasnella calospora MUT 4182]|uniref:F-box domain-containing protein n=1 Tax=Tulasnella calospora MUT 4182 TaxID=1051891 RepID=A0A0C3QA19_9AGAM|nr:hypothetical protein M407DRAFT_23697 [Tulasnella calospora MUT 4182]
MSTEKATHNPPESSVVESAFSMILASIQEQNRHSATPNDQCESDSLQSEIERFNRLEEDNIFAVQYVQLAVESVQLVAESAKLAAKSAQLAARRARASLLRQRNATVPLHQLPSEILVLILLETLDVETGCDQMTLRNLAQVAHRWWKIIKSEPRFWNCIVWPGDDIALAIRKAGTLPLQLTRQSWSSRSRNPEQDTGSLIRAHADRWFKISIRHSWGAPRLFADALEQSAFSRLEVLHMEGIVEVAHVEIGQIERLREALLSFIPCWGHGPKPINPAPLLTNLYLKLSSLGSYPSACLASFLRHCPNLQQLKIQDLWEDSDRDNTHSQSSSIISLPALRSLRIENLSKGEHSTEIPILGLISCPNLATLQIHYSLERDREGVDAAAVFRALWASSQLKPDALPMRSVVRKMGDSAYFSVHVENDQVRICAENRGSPKAPPVDFILPAYGLNMDDFSRDILPHLTSFDIPIELTTHRLDQGGGHWSDILDRFRNVTVLLFGGTAEPVQELIEALSQPSSSLPGGGPRAPRLEALRLQDAYYTTSWLVDQFAPHIAAMFEKRRGLFKSAGMVWPSKFRVIGRDFYTFNEDEGVWTAMPI